MVVSKVCKYCGCVMCVCSSDDREKRRGGAASSSSVESVGVILTGTSETGDSVAIYMRHLTIKDDGGNNIVLKGDPEIYNEFERVFTTIHEWMKRRGYNTLRQGDVIIDKYEIETLKDVFKKLTEIND